jgi:hypothetical protein
MFLRLLGRILPRLKLGLLTTLHLKFGEKINTILKLTFGLWVVSFTSYVCSSHPFRPRQLTNCVERFRKESWFLLTTITQRAFRNQF